MSADGEDLRGKVQRLVSSCGGVRMAAREVPADATTIYRLLSGVTEKPAAAVREGIERAVRRLDKEDES